MIPRADMVFVDPHVFTDADFPVIVLADDLQGWMGWVIKEHSSGNYNHVMVMRAAGRAVSQNTLLSEIPVDDYMNNHEMLKFWKIKGLSADEKAAILARIEKDLKKPWWGRMYDYLGIAGQALWLPKLQLPGLHYCSEAVSSYLRVVPRFAVWMPPEPSPAQMDAIFKAHPDVMEPIGYWWPA